MFAKSACQVHHDNRLFLFGLAGSVQGLRQHETHGPCVEVWARGAGAALISSPEDHDADFRRTIDRRILYGRQQETFVSKRQLILHVGCHKTGTSALQKQFLLNRDVLAAASVGLAEPTHPELGDHHFLVSFL